MSYQVIARKYRPQRFADVVGQEHVTQTLGNAISQKRIAHAYLFCGPRGTGKTTIARIFAKCLNCTGGPKVDFAEDDPRCKEIAEGRSLDVFEIDGASNRGIDEIRDLRETVKYAPANAPYKIYIIDEVHMLTKEAFNALLKTLEEPPEHVKFMFATTEPEKVLATILSRCQRFDLRRIPSALIVKHLAQIAKQENVTIDEPALYAIARGADGGMRDAESTLDQLISFCGDKIEENDVLSMFGLAARAQLMSLAGAVLAGEVEPALRELHGLALNGKDLSRLLSDLLNHFRNLLIFQISRGDLGLLEVSEAEAAVLKEQSAQAPADTLTRILEVLTDHEGRLRDAASKKILVEVALLKAIQARNAVSIDSVLKQLNSLRGSSGAATGGAAAVPAASAPEPAVKPGEPTTKALFGALRESLQAPAAAAGPAPAPASPKPAPAPTSAPAAAKAPLALAGPELHALWHKLVEQVAQASPFVKAYFLEAHPVSFEKNVLTIGFDPEFSDHLALVDNAKNHQLLHSKLAAMGHAGVTIKFVKAAAPSDWVRPEPVAAPEPAAPAQAPRAAAKPAAGEAAPKAKAKVEPIQLNKEEFKNDPLIKKALEVFKGHIVEVRA